MILGFKKKFPDGEQTKFATKILAITKPVFRRQFPNPKIHTIRKGKRWKQGNSIQMAYNVRTKNYYQFNKDIAELNTCKSVQDIYMQYSNKHLVIIIDKQIFYETGKSIDKLKLLVVNDGFPTIEKFMQWFFPDGQGEFDGQIIGWTNFKYFCA